MTDSTYTSISRRSVGLPTSSWRTHDEVQRAANARRYFAKLREAELASRKPQRNSNYDGEILKRRDRS